MSTLTVTEFTDPGCPWAYSASPALAVLRWRYGPQLDWRLVTIGLAEDVSRYEQAGYTPGRMALGHLIFRERYGMPFGRVPRERVTATAPACRAIVATRILAPGREREALRALQFAWFTSTLLLDQREDIADALERVPGLDAQAVVAALEEPETLEGYEADKQLTRTAEGGPTDFQGKARQTDGPVRYSAPSLVFESAGGGRLEAGGFQSAEAYDVLVANLDRTLERREPPEGALQALQAFPEGLVTQEVAAVLAHNNQPPDRDSAERELIELLAGGEVRSVTLGDDALWLAAA